MRRALGAWILAALLLSQVGCSRGGGGGSVRNIRQDLPPASPQLAVAVEPISLRVDTQATVQASAFGKTIVKKADANHASAAIIGGEKSQCMPYGRQSGSGAKADVTWERRDPLWLAVHLNASSDANGGHYRTCAGCFSNECVGIHGNDTTARASARSSATITITFDADALQPPDYSLVVKPAGDAQALVATLRSPDGSKHVIDVGKGEEPILLGKKGAIYHLDLALPAAAQNGGGCCSANETLASMVDVKVNRAPILKAGELSGFIVGGNQTTGYKNVGALLLDGAPHCSGTVIGPRTVLTAAHCVSGYEARRTNMVFVLGSNVNYPDGKPITLASWKYPDGTPPEYLYNPKTYEDDIAVVYLTEPVSVAAAAFYGGAPTWQKIRDDQTSLLFVGFGYNNVGGGLGGLGVKREGAWRIDGFTNRTVTFNVPGKSTCHGDSGGPAFVEVESKLLLAAVTSAGDKDKCTHGVETRVDAYAAWLKGKVA